MNRVVAPHRSQRSQVPVQRAGGVRRAVRTALLATLLTMPVFAVAQTLVEVTFVAATVMQLDPGLRLPSGSLRAVGPGVDRLLARLPDASAWTEPEAYVARGIAARLRPAFEHQVVSAFAVEGYFEVDRRTVPASPIPYTRVEFQGEDGTRTLLVLFDAPEEVTWLVARGR